MTKQIIRRLAACAVCLLWVMSFEAMAATLSVRHDLQVSLDPAHHRLTGIDRMEIETKGPGALHFFLSPRASDLEVLNDGQPAPFTFDGSVLRVSPPESGASATRRR